MWNVKRRWPAAALLALWPLCSLWACDSSPSAPTDVGYCWRMTSQDSAPSSGQGSGQGSGAPTFKPVSYGVSNLETCAAHLEAVAMRENRPNLTGAYQGQFIFITPEMVQSSMRLDGARYRLFDQETRGKIDHDLKWMLEDEKHPSKFAPQPKS